MSVEEKRSKLQWGLEHMERLLKSLDYAAPELREERLAEIEETRSQLYREVLSLETPPKTPEQKYAELREAIGVVATDDHDDACSYARDQATHAKLYREIRDIVADSEC